MFELKTKFVSYFIPQVILLSLDFSMQSLAFVLTQIFFAQCKVEIYKLADYKHPFLQRGQDNWIINNCNQIELAFHSRANIWVVYLKNPADSHKSWRCWTISKIKIFKKYIIYPFWHAVFTTSTMKKTSFIYDEL